MSGKIVKVLPMLMASVSLFAATDTAHKKYAKKMDRETASLCHPNPRLECDTPWDVSASATYLQVRVQSGEIASITNDRTVQAYPVGAVGVQPQDDFAWGFQVGAGYTILDESWRFGVNYNYYKCITNTAPEISYGQAFVPSAYTNQQVDGSATSTAMFNNLQSGTYMLLNEVEFLLDRATMITPNLEITTLFGIDAQFMQRRQLNVFTNSLQDSMPPYDSSTTGYMSVLGGYFQNYQKYTWWGVGPELGVHTNWAIGNNVSFFGDAFGALAYGFSNTRTATFSKRINGATSSGTPLGFIANEAAVQNGMYQFSPSVKYMLGFSWFKVLESNDTKFTFKIAYENEYFFYLMKTIVPEGAYQSVNGAGIGIQGLVLNAAYDF